MRFGYQFEENQDNSKKDIDSSNGDYVFYFLKDPSILHFFSYD